MIIQVIKRGEVFKVACPKWNEKRLLVNCDECPDYKGYDKKTNSIKCGEVAA